MGAIPSSKTDTPNLTGLNIQDVARRLTAAGEHLNPAQIVKDPTAITQEEFRQFKAVIDHKLTNLAQMVAGIQRKAEAAMADVQAAPVDLVRERRILELAIGMVVRDFEVPHKSKDVLADRLDAVEQTYKRLITIVSEAK